jgi:uncharacterized protein (TIGR00288 family)
MMPTPGARLPYGAAPTPTYHPAPNAALLIDFDNVTMGIRSDLGKELKSLLKSDVIRGKVAVQRAYADWRRYPQYIVPLTESSIDLIFAPAYGSSKKNATDLRMAIDAIELVFTRPEIGTFILMTGDSDFSSCVLKLKEYGKYVIGVGMRESSSDLLIQNCDEYYSYHSLYGMTRAGEVTESREDPWILVRRAVQQMAANGDVMRTDRLKQVMLDLDAGFDEKKVGYNKFSLFVREAANKGLIRLRRGENGQQELLPVEEGEGGAEAESAAPAPRRSSSRRDDGRRGRESRREPRAPRPEPIETPAAAEATTEEPAAAAQPEAAPAPAAAPEPSPAITVGDGVPGLAQAYALLQESVRNLTSANGSRSVRDGDVKREMLRLAPGFDEETLGFSKFTRFLRQAHDAEVIDLNRAAGGNYEVSLPANGKRLPPPSLAAPDARATAASMAPPAPAEPEAAPAAAPETRAAATPAETPAASTAAAPVGALRGRRGGRRGVAEGVPPILPGQVVAPVPGVAPAPAAPEVPAPAEEAAAEAQAVAPADEKGKGRSRRGRRGGRGRSRGETAAEAAVTETAVTADEAIPAPLEEVAAPAPEVEVPVAEAPAAETPAAAVPAAPKRGRGRGRGRGAAAAEGMPPILPGQAVAAPTLPGAEPAAAPPAEAAETAEPAAAAPKRGRGRGRGKGRDETKEAAPQAAPPAAPEPAGFSAEALGLPQGAAEIEAYLTSAYKGVGKKTAEQLVASFGGDVFREMEENPDRVRQVLGDRRANALLEQWQADRVKRTPAEPVAEEQPAKPKSRARRGGRGRGPKKQGTPAE